MGSTLEPLQTPVRQPFLTTCGHCRDTKAPCETRPYGLPQRTSNGNSLCYNQSCAITGSSSRVCGLLSPLGLPSPPTLSAGWPCLNRRTGHSLDRHRASLHGWVWPPLTKGVQGLHRGLRSTGPVQLWGCSHARGGHEGTAPQPANLLFQSLLLFQQTCTVLRQGLDQICSRERVQSYPQCASVRAEDAALLRPTHLCPAPAAALCSWAYHWGHWLCFLSSFSPLLKRC